MSKPPEMPKFKALRPMAPDDPFYRRGYVVGAGVLGRSSGSPGKNPERDGDAHQSPPTRTSGGGLSWKGWGTLASRLGDNVSLITGANLRGSSTTDLPVAQDVALPVGGNDDAEVEGSERRGDFQGRGYRDRDAESP